MTPEPNRKFARTATLKRKPNVPPLHGSLWRCAPRYSWDRGWENKQGSSDTVEQPSFTHACIQDRIRFPIFARPRQLIAFTNISQERLATTGKTEPPLSPAPILFPACSYISFTWRFPSTRSPLVVVVVAYNVVLQDVKRARKEPLVEGYILRKKADEREGIEASLAFA